MARDGVSLRDIYDAVNSLERKMSDRFDKVESRVNNLETFKDKTLGMVSVFTVFISLAVNFVWEKIVGRA